MDLNNEQYEILYHTKWRAAGGAFCGAKDNPDMKALVDEGLMIDAGRPGWIPESDSYFRITPAGAAALKAERQRRGT